MQDLQHVRGTKGESDSMHILFDELQYVDANHLATQIHQRATAVAGIDWRIGLHPSAGTRIGKSPHRANDALCRTEKHGVAWISNGQYRFALAHPIRADKR